jgi:hypothetical protein
MPSMAQSPAPQYTALLQQHRGTLALLLKKRGRLGWARLAAFLLTIAACYFTFTQAGLWGLLPLTGGLALLLFLVSLDVTNNNRIAYTRRLVRINEEELQVLEHRFTHRYGGEGLAPAAHDYAGDLDLFGASSIYQWLNRCFTEQGRKLLAEELLRGLPAQAILARQATVKELAPRLQWRQHWQATAEKVGITEATERKVRSWAGQPLTRFTSPFWTFFLHLYTLLSLLSVAAVLLGWISPSLFSALFTFYFVFSFSFSSAVVKPYAELAGIVKEIDTLHGLIEAIEGESFHSEEMHRLQGALQTEGGSARAIRNLKRILDRFDLRLNLVGLIFFNSFLLWDLRQLLALNRWKGRHARLAPSWFTVIAEMELLHSLATLHFNEPGWCFPEPLEGEQTVEGEHIGHPLLPATQRVTNDFRLSGKGTVGLITGSNMAGKSTFLRSLGVNLVLAQLGAPVCAERFRFFAARLMSSMRIADNLAENTSTFYAELKKLKSIIEAARQPGPLFILLDEILRGTNSLDRHTGSEALIRQLTRTEALSILATHDVELAAMEKEFKGILFNYHFDVQVAGEELYFDYRLKDGVCTSLNASILMKKIGIEL